MCQSSFRCPKECGAGVQRDLGLEIRWGPRVELCGMNVCIEGPAKIRRKVSSDLLHIVCDGSVHRGTGDLYTTALTSLCLIKEVIDIC